MHAFLFNELVLNVTLSPRGPMLVKSGAGAETVDPTLPDMNFVRYQTGAGEQEVYVPGSSLRGVLRSHAEALLRSLDPNWACFSVGKVPEGRGWLKACSDGLPSGKDMDGPAAYRKSCRACRLFGNTVVASRLQVGDLYPNGKTALATRFGVAIDRVTGAVAVGPFELETLTEGEFSGRIRLTNFTLEQLGLLAATLLDVAEGLVPVGFGKSRGLGRVKLTFPAVGYRSSQPENGKIRGLESLVKTELLEQYGIRPSQESLDAPGLTCSRPLAFGELPPEGVPGVLERAATAWSKAAMAS